MKSVNLLLRGLLGLGGAGLVYLALPVAQGAWDAARADGVATALREDKPVRFEEVSAGIDALNRAVAADPVAGRYLQRSALVVGAALSPDVPLSTERRVAWLRNAESDLVAGLGSAPARGVSWARLASVRQGLYGSTPGVVDALMMSLDTAPMLSPIWPARLRLILDNWAIFTQPQRERLVAYTIMTWRLSSDRRWFANVLRTPIDELFVRYFLRNEPGAQAELEKWIKEAHKEWKKP